MGYHGAKCDRSSNLSRKFASNDLVSYEKREVSDRLSIFWKVLDASQELEVVLKLKGTTFVAMGMRPRNTDKTCQAFPKLGELADEAAAESEAEPEGRSADCFDNTFSHPAGCQGDACTYVATWVRKGDYVEVEVKHKAEESMWTGIGFSRNRQMVNQVVKVGCKTCLETLVSLFSPSRMS